jgi:hypothetical protein
MYVLWDGYKHEGFAFSKNAQVKGEVIWDASILGIARAERRLASGTETVIACRHDHFFEAIHERVTTDDG